MTPRLRLAMLAITVAGAAAACRKPPAPAPAPVPAPNADSIARAAAVRDSIARADAARRDATARAEAARRDSLARADAARRAAADSAAAVATLAEPIYFDFEIDELRADATGALDRKAALLSASPTLRIRITGHADERGSDEFNLALGQRRAATARRYLVARGIAEYRIEVESYGEQRPVCGASDESCWQRNRRDEFVIVAGAVVIRTSGAAP
jgi:peptidoglycan-associated lipoprotein